MKSTHILQCDEILCGKIARHCNCGHNYLVRVNGIANVYGTNSLYQTKYNYTYYFKGTHTYICRPSATKKSINRLSQGTQKLHRSKNRGHLLWLTPKRGRGKGARLSGYVPPKVEAVADRMTRKNGLPPKANGTLVRKNNPQLITR